MLLSRRLSCAPAAAMATTAWSMRNVLPIGVTATPWRVGLGTICAGLTTTLVQPATVLPGCSRSGRGAVARHSSRRRSGGYKAAPYQRRTTTRVCGQTRQDKKPASIKGDFPQATVSSQSACITKATRMGSEYAEGTWPAAAWLMLASPTGGEGRLVMNGLRSSSTSRRTTSPPIQLRRPVQRYPSNPCLFALLPLMNNRRGHR